MIQAVITVFIFGVTLYLIFSERLNRTTAAMAGAVVMVTAGMLGGFYDGAKALAAVDFHTLGLLFGMMTLVALLEPTGFFEVLAIWAARFSQGKPLRLLVLLGSVTTFLSMFLDNVTTVVLIAPVSIMVCEILGISPVPILMSEALLSDTGGVATLIGDPPNVLIASAAKFSFVDFLTHALPVVVVAWLATLALLSYLFRRELWATPANREAVLGLNPAEAVRDGRTMRRVLLVLGLTILLFFFEEPLQLSPAHLALGAAAAAMVWTKPDVRQLFARIEWGVLIFFGALFIMVGGLEAAGVLAAAAALLGNIGNGHPILLGLAVLWAVAALSAVVDNVPITIALIPVIQGLGEAGISISALWWALAFGAGFGGNATIIGSTANIVVASLSERTRFPITAALWNRRGLPAALLTCVTASVLFAAFYPLLAK
jgi:Na+/H+ antiporter NhaD/arsenite permease-like protein